MIDIGTFKPETGRHRVDLKPSYDRSNGWFELMDAAGEIGPASTLVGEHKADYVVIGGGYSGLSATRRLAELNPDSSVYLIDGGRIGNNAAGRSSGFAIDHAHNLRAKNFADAGPEAQAASLQEIALNRAGLDYLDKTIAINGIECGWVQEGKYHAAATDRGERMLNAFAESLDAMGEDYSLVDAAECQAIFGSTFYRRAVHAPHSYLTQPAAMVRGLADTMPSNVTVFEDSMVTSVTYGTGAASPHRLNTEAGSVVTPCLVLATNGFIEGFGFYQRHLIPIMTWGSMTRELTEAESNRIGGASSYGIIAAHPAGTSVRRISPGSPASPLSLASPLSTPGSAVPTRRNRRVETAESNRIVVRNIFSFSRRSDFVSRKAWATKTHRQSFERRWPELGDVPFEHSWGGAMALTRNGQPVWGELRPGVFGTVVHNGVGIARGTVSGKTLAEFISGEDSELVAAMAKKGRPDRKLPFQDLGVRINARARRLIAGLEE